MHACKLRTRTFFKLALQYFTNLLVKIRGCYIRGVCVRACVRVCVCVWSNVRSCLTLMLKKKKTTQHLLMSHTRSQKSTHLHFKYSFSTAAARGDFPNNRHPFTGHKQWRAPSLVSNHLHQQATASYELLMANKMGSHLYCLVSSLPWI